MAFVFLHMVIKFTISLHIFNHVWGGKIKTEIPKLLDFGKQIYFVIKTTYFFQQHTINHC